MSRSDEWKLKFHPDKANRLRIGCVEPTSNYELQGNVIKTLEHKRDLGITIDDTLNFKRHVNDVVLKANRVLYTIKRTINVRDSKAFVLLYKSLVRPILDYNNPIVWSNISLSEIDKLESIQGRATRMIVNVKNLPYEERLKYLKIPCLTYRRLRYDMIETFKLVTNVYSTDNDIIMLDARRRFTRGHPYKLEKRRCRKNIRLKYFTNRIINYWNSLPTEVVETPSVNSFKARLDDYWKDYELKTNYKLYRR
ncbi:uncharacterized protein LOC141911564 [Tubulanus polymorphus]|uniref:uncharacterized protein LOC141911564 n=1 Tax=Tubulanus polymorphus TaxID=672921 RepID=UPI003DA66845